MPNVRFPSDQEEVLLCTWKQLFDDWMREIRWPIIQQVNAQHLASMHSRSASLLSCRRMLCARDRACMLACPCASPSQVTTDVWTKLKWRRKKEEYRPQQQLTQAAEGDEAAGAAGAMLHRKATQLRRTSARPMCAAPSAVRRVPSAPSAARRAQSASGSGRAPAGTSRKVCEGHGLCDCHQA